MVRNTFKSVAIAAAVVLAAPALAQDASRELGERWRDCEGCPEMVLIPAGTFVMGSPDSESGRYEREGPVREVVIPEPFAISVYEVTRGEYARFVRATNYLGGSSCLVNEGHGWELHTGLDWEDPGFPQTPRHPAVCISWDDASAYVEWLTQRTGIDYRLPSAAEWEYAARAGTSTPWYWGDNVDMQCHYANGADVASGFPWSTGCDDGYTKTALVGLFRANAFGLYDMLGNAWEWVQDCFNWSYEHAPTTSDPWEEGDCANRVMRGASWASTPTYLRAAHRGGEQTTFRSDYTGFRVVRSQ